MEGEQDITYMLDSFRVLDLTSEMGLLCGRILGDLGADVIKIERPKGDQARNIGPFYHDTPHPHKSLYWMAYNSNKRGITLNIETATGQDLFKRLVRTADFVVESFPPGHMDRFGLGYSALSEINPRVIMTSITPFGQSGPYKDYEASDIVAEAMGGLMYLTGDPDRPPVRVGFPQAHLHAGSEAAVGSMVAHYWRELSGEGQHVDVSMQASICLPTLNAPSFWDLNQVNLRRVGHFRGGMSGHIAPLPTIWPCKDGYISFSLFGGKLGEHTNLVLVEWMDSDIGVPEFWKHIDWLTFDISENTKSATPEQFRELAQRIGEFFLIHTMSELYEGAQKRRMMLYPTYTTKDILEDPQLHERQFWEEVEHPELGTTITYPGAFAKSTETRYNLRRRAPLIGEHNQEIYEKELGLTREDLVLLKHGGVI